MVSYYYLLLLSVFILWFNSYGKELFIRFTARAFRKLLSIYVFSYFAFGFEGRIWDLIVSVPDHCLSFFFVCSADRSKNTDALEMDGLKQKYTI